MRTIFCDSGFSPKEVDYMYAEEFDSAKKNLFPVSLLSFEEIKKGNIQLAIKRVRISEEIIEGIYRGWMLKPVQYQQLYDGLLEKNIKLVNSPAQYKFCHYLPESYDCLLYTSPSPRDATLSRMPSSA